MNEAIENNVTTVTETESKEHTTINVYSVYLANYMAGVGHFTDLIEIGRNKQDNKKRVWKFRKTDATQRLLDTYIENRKNGINSDSGKISNPICLDKIYESGLLNELNMTMLNKDGIKHFYFNPTDEVLEVIKQFREEYPAETV